MNRLIEAELFYGRLLRIAEPHLVARYNKAMTGFGLKPTSLAEFDIDMMGFSPQIADELDDMDYLDPHRANRRFIIMTPDQVNLPVVHTSFSNTAGLMHEFFEANAKAILAITIKDAIYGEIEDSVAKVEHIEDLLSINEVVFKVFSAEDILGKAAELRAAADRLISVPDAWRDDKLLDRMVELAQATGDIRQNNLVPDQLVFRHETFWANHFDGVFVFHDGKSTTVICRSDVPGFRKTRPWQVSYIDIEDYETIFGFLARTGRVQLPQAEWVLDSGLYQHRADLALISLAHATDPKIDFSKVDSVYLQTWAHAHADAVAEEGSYPFLADMMRQIRSTGRIGVPAAAGRFRLMLVRPEPKHPDRWLTGRLLAQLNPADFVSRFIFDKHGFYAAYATYTESFRDYVVDRLENTYLKDKAGFRRKLYGMGKDD